MLENHVKIADLFIIVEAECKLFIDCLNSLINIDFLNPKSVNFFLGFSSNFPIHVFPLFWESLTVGVHEKSRWQQKDENKFSATVYVTIKNTLFEVI